MAYTTIKKPSNYFNTVLYTGNGSTQSITGVGFQPDMLWGKNRSTITNHELTDVVRGINQRLKPNDTDADQTNTTTFTSFDSDGFTVGNNGDVNNNGSNQVVWSWLADNTSGSANTDGSISSTVSVNTTSGFSVGTFSGNATTGATVGHGLGVAPSMFIVKKTSGVGDWYVYHSGIGATKFIKLNEESVATTNTLWNDTAPTSTVFSMDNNSAVNGSGESYVFYAFANIQGYSKFGSYTGNGSTDGTFIYTGQKSAFVMIKRTDSAGSWYMYDNKINPENVMDTILFANTSAAESTNSNENLDFLSNGFKLRTTSAARNASGGSYIYMAFAEQPLVGDNPATAR